MYFLFILLLQACFCQATITLTATGQHFSSHPDETVGTRFLQGFEYLARLQVFTENLELCPSIPANSNLNVTVPPDGLPVAILARNTGCSVETKARLASYAVEPPHKLKYLILYGDDGRLPEVMMEETSLEKTNGRDLDISVGVLHVSERSGNELLWTITNQSTESKNAGGPRLLLDGRDASRSKFMRDFTLWMGVGVMCMACLFSFFLSIRAQQGAFTSAPLQGEPPRRPERRRLSPIQVQEFVSEFTASDYLDQIHVEESLSHHHHYHAELCSICLDEYAPDDVLGELPCAHVFHANCIKKWLTERSSTCPLCKTDLLTPDQDSDDEDDSVSQTTTSQDDSIQFGVFGFMDGAISRWRRRRRTSQEGNEEGIAVEEHGVSQQPLLEHGDGEDGESSTSR